MPVDSTCCAIFELRQYTLRPGQRDALIAVFDREFVETQEATGMRILGQFREHAPNDYPNLPVREGEDVFVRFPSFESAATHAAGLERLDLRYE